MSGVFFLFIDLHFALLFWSFSAPKGMFVLLGVKFRDSAGDFITQDISHEIKKLALMKQPEPRQTPNV